MEPELTIFMIGGRRCGKTTVLSKIYRQFNNVLHHGPNEGPDLFSLNLDAADIPHITAAECGIQSIFGDNDEFDDFLVENVNPNSCVVEFGFRLAPSTTGFGNQALKISFRDIPGEWCNGQKLDVNGLVDNIVTTRGVRGAREETKSAIEFVVDYIQVSTVTIIAIDTPAMMEENGAFNNTINRVGPITQAFKTALTNTDGDENISDKLILFVPLKCEKYVVRGDGTIDNDGMRMVTRRVRESYAELIDFISGHPTLSQSVSAAILPIVTIKEVLWSHFGCFWKGERASIFNDRGCPRNFPEYYDPNNLIYPYYSFRNSALYHDALATGSKSEFCEQPLVYSLVYAMRHYLYRLQNPARTGRGVISVMISAIRNFMARFFANNPAFSDEARRLSTTKLLRGNGFEIIQDYRRHLA